MAILLGRRSAYEHGLDPDVARELLHRLDAGVRHWTAAVQCARWRRNLEVVDGDGGIWRVRPVERRVELAPTSTTAVVREPIALVFAATTESEPVRGPMNADRPASPSD